MNSAQVLAKQQAYQKILSGQGLEAAVVTSFDRYLNEYVPLSDCHRYELTGFAGSVAEVLLPVNGRALLFVDGRYHEQADGQCDPKLVEVIKCPYGVSNLEALEEIIIERKLKKVAIEGARFAIGPWRRLQQCCDITVLSEDDLASVSFGTPPVQGEMVLEDDNLCGETVSEKLQRLCLPGEAIFVSTLDSVAWLTNTRGYQLPYQATSRAVALARRDGITLIADQYAKISEQVKQKFNVVSSLKEIDPNGLGKIIIYPMATSVADYLTLKELNIPLEERPGSLALVHAIKNNVEVKVMEDSFARGDKAIFKTLSWLKEQVKTSTVSEQEWNNKTSEYYREQGAKGQSFKTISGFGANSSVIHYGTPSEKKFWQKGELALLDSGGFFAGGLATDTTRTLVPDNQGSEKQKEIYTLVLKGLLQAQNAIFPEGTRGQAIDALARAPMRRHGYDYAHGTGHGVGVNVHEAGYSLTPLSQVPLYAGRVGSIEPGIYVPNFGGVRLENIVVVEKHSSLKGMLHFRPLVWIGFEPSLIESKLLNSDEVIWLEAYEAECTRRGTSFRE